MFGTEKATLARPAESFGRVSGIIMPDLADCLKRYLAFHVPLISSALVCFSSCPFFLCFSLSIFLDFIIPSPLSALRAPKKNARPFWRFARFLRSVFPSSSSSSNGNQLKSILATVNLKPIHGRIGWIRSLKASDPVGFLSTSLTGK